jgi:hypothetical protein
MVNQTPEIDLKAVSVAGMPITETSAAIKQAFRDWNTRRAYLDNGGNYHVRSEPATPTHRPSGKIAPWNKEVKRRFVSCGEFHAAAAVASRGDKQ